MGNRCTLLHLIDLLKERGVLWYAPAYDVEPCWRSMTIDYYNRQSEKSKLYICRTGRLSFYIFYAGHKVVKKTAEQTCDFIEQFIVDSVYWRDYISSMDGITRNIFYNSTLEQKNKRFEQWKSTQKARHYD